MRYLYHILLCCLIVVGVCCLTSCEERVSTSANDRLYFSADTVRFDTLFTGIGSATYNMRVYNHTRNRLNISSVYLEKGASSAFRFNLDGYPTRNGMLKDIEIAGRDSMFLFISVNIEADNQSVPILSTDRLHFVCNGNDHVIELEAVGRNAVVMRDLLITHDTTLTADRPYIVYGYLAVDSLHTLHIAPGAEFYFHADAQLIVLGNIDASGTVERPIRMQGDRLDHLFDNVPYSMSAGQWGGIVIASVGGTNTLLNTEIRSAGYGVYATYQGRNGIPVLNIENCLIHNCSQYGLAAINTTTKVVNTEISNCAAYCVYLSGGDHQFIHNTIANYFGSTTVNIQSHKREQTPAVCINDIPKGAPMSARFYNCIITGTRQEEWALLSYFADKFDGTFMNNYIHAADSTSLNAMPQYVHNQFGLTTDTLFVNSFYEYGVYADYDFRLDSASVARSRANDSIALLYPTDRLGNDRTADGKPDLGCYEWISQ